MKINNKIFKKTIALSLIAIFLVLNIFVSHEAVAVDSLDDTKDALESTEKKIEKEMQALNIANSKYVKVASQVKTTTSLLNETTSEIKRKEVEIKNLNDQITLYKTILSAYLQEMYFGNQDQVVKLAVANESLDAIFSNDEQMLNVKEKILQVLDDIDVSQNKLAMTTDELVDQKAEHERLLQQKKTEQGEIAEDIQDTKATLAELQKKFDKLQNDLNELMGASYDAKDIKDAVGFASSRTGVPKGVLYGFLTQESGRGKNVGQCTYADVKKVSLAGYKKYGKRYQASIDLLYKREKLFNSLLGDLNYKSKKVSCTIPFSSAGPNQGGAMGAAQFMSDTWLAYESRISAQTGHSNPDPWNITDAVMAMAIKIKSAGGTSDSNAAIKKSVTNYYGIFSQGYYNTVVYWSKNYKDLL
jgi:membrane-bound lytic murein transglycosylase B